MIERILIVVGEPDAGKSTQLRSLFVDPRLGTNGRIPETRNVADHYRLSIDRSLYLRLTSPHERGETMGRFLAKIEQWTRRGRWCAAIPLQPNRRNRMPGIVQTVQALKRRFKPERVRVCFIAPDARWQPGNDSDIQRWFQQLWRLGGVECQLIDGRDRKANGTMLADFLDYS